MKYITLGVGAFVGLSACMGTPDFRSNFVEPSQVEIQQTGPKDAPDGTCWGRDETAAEIETVTHTILEEPEERAEDGTVTKAAVYTSKTFQRIVQDRDAIWFETPCDEAFTPDVVAALQRSLTARGLMQGDATGVLDLRTSRAVRVYQKPLGLNSGQLSLIAARKLGLIAYDRSDIDTF
ncbi:MAG: peptidoglycan-binding domain-containing protein [Planktomarina sp.]